RRAPRTSRCRSTAMHARPSCQPRDVVVPVAPEDAVAVEAPLGREEGVNGRMRGLELLPRREAVIREEVAAAMAQRVVDQPSEVPGGDADVPWAMIDVQIEHDAGPGRARPGQRRV